MADEHARRIADVAADGVEIVGVRGDVDPGGVGGGSAATVPAVVPVDERDGPRQVVP